jgi:fused signal recognition particle receptor
MAFGFIKKVFSFGSKRVEEASAEDAGQPLGAPVADQADAERLAAEQAARETEEKARQEAEAAQAAREAEEKARLLAEADRIEAEWLEERSREVEETERLAQEDARRLAEEEAARLTDEAARKRAQEVAEQERQASAREAAEDERLARERAEQDARQRAEQEAAAQVAREAAEKAEQERLAAAERDAERLAEAERAAEAERIAAKTVAAPAPAAPREPEGKVSEGKVTVAKTVEKKAEPVAPAEPAPKLSWFQRMKDGLARSSRELSGNIAGVFTKRKLDEETLQDLEDVLIRADLGVETALRVTDSLAASRYGKDVSDSEVRAVMAAEVEKVLAPVARSLELDLSHKPHVVLVVGVNGTGKTTTIGKLAAKLTEGGLSVMLAAGDTFRAAAIEQLKIWGERTGSPVVATKLGADAAGLAYDAFEKAKAAGSDVLIIDTAGRLQNKAELMAELEKIVRVLGKLDPEAPHTVLQTVDATTGQNALNQVEIFRNIAGVNGLVMTKLDGTARGGILVAIAAKHKLPVYFIGVGEQVDDLEPFSASDFAKAIAGVG